ncbi:MAG TPA: hypothetical protein VMF89_13255, partial [Polyangiales bacterium]|nr:hypothetical protein [Polyangiales bacterium]
MMRWLNRMDARLLLLAVIVSSPFLRADGGCGESACGKYAEAHASGRITQSTCGNVGAFSVRADAQSCAVVAELNEDSGLPNRGNRNTDSFRSIDWELSGRHDGSPLRCTVENVNNALRFACKSEAGFSCTADFEITDE